MTYEYLLPNAALWYEQKYEHKYEQNYEYESEFQNEFEYECEFEFLSGSEAEGGAQFKL